MKKQKRILIVRTDRLGDVIMITPMVRELKKTFPDCFIAVLIRTVLKPVFENNPFVDLIITDDLDKKSYWNVVNEIRTNKFSHGLLVFPTERAAYQMFLGGVKKRFLTGTKLYGSITLMHSVSRNKYKNLKHEADYCMDLARRIGVVTNNIQPEIYATYEERDLAKNVYLKHGAGNDTFKIIVHSGSGNSAPNWSEGKYLNLLKEISKKYKGNDYRIFLTAVEMTNEFREKALNIPETNISDISDELNSLKDLIGVISECNVIMTSSTGPAHIGDALNKKVVAIHCHREMSCSKHWGTINPVSVNMEVSDEHCSGNCSKDKQICDIENGISVKEVIKHI